MMTIVVSLIFVPASNPFAYKKLNLLSSIGRNRGDVGHEVIDSQDPVPLIPFRVERPRILGLQNRTQWHKRKKAETENRGHNDAEQKSRSKKRDDVRFDPHTHPPALLQKPPLAVICSRSLMREI
ncbi:MAG TPA: hypothetical protein VN876_00175, partial [Gemmatimonadaceae bacterium]|nr:hypothetical protein [Gemmatimonadaceae bacterium]